jgi:glycopeptide antibiotics resistance protein
VIPVFYHALQKAVLVPPWKDSRPVRDIAINLFGFIPFGFFYFMYRMKKNAGAILRNAAATVILSGLISAAIELLQVYLPTRASQLTDIMCNTAGSLLGVLIAAALSLIQSRAPRRMSA